MTVDSACSTGLLTVHMGCRSLHEGETDLALAGGFLSSRRRRRRWACCYRGGLPAVRRGSGRDRAGVRDAPWSCPKRLPNALADDDRILAVVVAPPPTRMATPRPFPGRRYKRRPRSTGLHLPWVTSTPQPLAWWRPTAPAPRSAIRSSSAACRRCTAQLVSPGHWVRPNATFGHTESASSTVGLIKTILSLRHGVLPPMVHYTGLANDLCGCAVTVQTAGRGNIAAPGVSKWPVRMLTTSTSQLARLPNSWLHRPIRP
jgi:Beta-ketoacyl synthase, N-terminal domain/Beta-ketoacyl synthase, C-terminal domain